MTPVMEAMQVSRRLCQMVYDAGLPSESEERLRLALAAAGVSGMFDAGFAAWFKEAVVGFVDSFIGLTKKVDELSARLQPTRPASALPTALVGLRGDRLYRVLMALNLPANAAANVHLEVALAAQRLVQHDAVHAITHVYEKIVSEGDTEAAYDDTTVANVRRRLNLDAFVQKHIDLADAAAAAAAAAASPAAGPSN